LSAGTAVSFGLCAAHVPFRNIAGAFFALSTLMWPILYYVVWKYTTNTNYGTETMVIPPVHMQEELNLDGKNELSQQTVEVANVTAKGAATKTLE
jgi:hypothetical protein